jgi:hypothetical protein
MPGKTHYLTNHCGKICLPPHLSIFQRIEALQISNSLRMFGQSISGQIDADNNGYIGEYTMYHVSYTRMSSVVDGCYFMLNTQN